MASEPRYTNSAGETIETAGERLNYYIEDDSKQAEVEEARKAVAEQRKKQAERDAQNPRQ